VSWICLCTLVAACSGGAGKSGSSSPTSFAQTAMAAPRPVGVPASAVPLLSDAEFGSPSATADAGSADGELFYSESCTDDVLVLVTNRRVVYAELACDRDLPPSARDAYLGKPLHLRIVVARKAKLYFDSATVGSVELTVGRIWLVLP
jgi:hypothetical protein